MERKDDASVPDRLRFWFVVHFAVDRLFAAFSALWCTCRFQLCR